MLDHLLLIGTHCRALMYYRCLSNFSRIESFSCSGTEQTHSESRPPYQCWL